MSFLRNGPKLAPAELCFYRALGEAVPPGLVIELDDKTHQRPEARQRDAFKDAALSAAGVPILRVPVAGKDDAGELTGKIGEPMS